MSAAAILVLKMKGGGGASSERLNCEGSTAHDSHGACRLMD